MNFCRLFSLSRTQTHGKKGLKLINLSPSLSLSLVLLCSFSQPDYYRVLKADDGSSVALSSFENKQPVVLAFYPAAATPGCTKEMCSIRDSWSALTATRAAVFGISGDEPAKNAAFRSANNLPFKLLSDSGNFLRKSFGIKGDLLGLLPG